MEGESPTLSTKFTVNTFRVKSNFGYLWKTFQVLPFDKVFLCLKFVFMPILHIVRKSIEYKMHYFHKTLKTWIFSVVIIFLCLDQKVLFFFSVGRKLQKYLFFICVWQQKYGIINLNVPGWTHSKFNLLIMKQLNTNDIQWKTENLFLL